MKALLVVAAAALLSACGTTYKPCTNGGELIAWDPALKGNRTCHQRRLKDGSWVNHGKYYEYHPSGKVGIEGEYDVGKKIGTWIRYDETGKKLAERFFEKGVEVTTLQPPPPAGLQKARSEELKRLGAAPEPKPSAGP